MRKYWEDQRLLDERKELLESGKYEEVEGCLACLDETRRPYTMPWPVVPKQRCSKHPRYLLRKGLVIKKET